MKKELKVALVGIGRLENRYAREWVQHHLNIGFSHVFIADNNRRGEERFEDVLGDYIKQGLVSVLDYRDKAQVHFRAYNEIYSRYCSEYDWLAFFDFDEFLDIRDGDLQSFLTDRKSDVVMVNWECYGDNGLVKYDGRPLAVRFTTPIPSDTHVQYEDHTENEHVKSFVRGGLPFAQFTKNPHLPDIQNALGYENAARKRCTASAFQAFDPSVAVVRHYVTKTAEEWARKWNRGPSDMPMSRWRSTYADRFFKYNERTKEKEQIMTKEKTVAIVHYNTPELTEATILSIRKHGGEDYKVVIFDNSDTRPFKKKMRGVRRIDNTNGQYINFDAELAKYPDKCQTLGVNGQCFYGSDKHMMSVQKLFELLPDGFLLMDSDILLKANVDFMFMEDQCVCGHIQTADKSHNRFGIERLVPMLCWINVPMCKSCCIDYWDPARSWGLHPGGKDNRFNWYDTGASFLEDIKSHRNGAHGKRIDIRPLMEHLQSGSWRNSGESRQKEWLEAHADLWKPESKPKTTKSTNSKSK